MSRPALLLGIVLLALGALLATWLVSRARAERLAGMEDVQESTPEPTSPAELRAPEHAPSESVLEPTAGLPARRSVPAEEPTIEAAEVAPTVETAVVIVQVVLPRGIAVLDDRRWDEVSVTCSRFQAIRGRRGLAHSVAPVASGRPAENGTFTVERAPLDEVLTLVVWNPFGPAWNGRIAPLLARERRVVVVQLELGREPCRLRGQVLGLDGRPVGGARVMSYPGLRRSATDSEGRFVLEGLPPGEVKLEAELGRASAHATVVLEPGAEGEVELRLVQSVYDDEVVGD